MMSIKSMKKFMLVGLVALTVMASGCAPAMKMAQPDQLTAPTPIASNTGKYMCPYTTDDVLAEWVDSAVKAKAAGAIGGAVGAYAGAKAMEQIPFIGGFLGKKVGNKIGKEIAIKAAGGREAIMAASDLSFNSVDDMAVYLYVKYSTSEHYKDALDACNGIYPEFKQQYSAALWRASRAVR